jgi:hypothetical protein
VNISARRFGPMWLVAGLAVCLSVVSMPGSAASASSLPDSLAATQVILGAHAVASSSGWGTAEEVPGTAALNAGGLAVTLSVSCASAGNCSAGGSYVDGSGHFQAFVVNEVSGVWRTAKEVPGTAALNAGGFAQTLSVSCASAANCSAGGSYADSSFHTQAFVVNKT